MFLITVSSGSREIIVLLNMDSKRAVSSNVGERPISHWRRNQEDSIPSTSTKIERPFTGIVRAQSKYDRPKSRRGSKDEPSENTSSNSNIRSSTPGRFALARPPSASLLSNRAPTASSRLTRMDSALSRATTGSSSSKQFNMSVLDRPITQHGVAGVRPGTTRGLPMTR